MNTAVGQGTALVLSMDEAVRARLSRILALAGYTAVVDVSCLKDATQVLSHTTFTAIVLDTNDWSQLHASFVQLVSVQGKSVYLLEPTLRELTLPLCPRVVCLNSTMEDEDILERLGVASLAS